MNSISSDQTTERALFTAKKQKERAEALPCSDDAKRAPSQSPLYRDSVCIDQGVLGTDQSSTMVNIGSMTIADGCPPLNVFEGSEHSMTSQSNSSKMSVNDPDGSTRETSPGREDSLSSECHRHVATNPHWSTSDETIDGLKVSPFSLPSVLGSSEVNDFKTATHSEIVLNGGTSVNKQVLALLNLHTDRPRAPQQSTNEAQWPIRFSEQLTQSLKRMAQEHDVDLGAVLLTAWSAVLFRLSGQCEIHLAIQGNTLGDRVRVADPSAYLSLHVDFSDDPNTIQLLEHVKQAASYSEDHQIEVNQVVFSYHRKEGSNSTGLGLALSGAITAGFELELSLRDENEEIVGLMCYSTALFDSLTIEHHVGYLNLMLEGMVSDATQLVSKIDIISPAERTLLLETWNETQPLHHEYQTIHQLFEEQAKRTPTAVALVHEDQELTYSELNARSNRLAHQLIELGVKPDTLAAICVERSLALTVAILAVLKAGGAYVPLDLTYPRERLVGILEDAAPAVMVIDKAGRAVFGETALSSLTLVDPNTPSAHPAINPRVPGLTSQHLAYIIYTSGSTGMPKGVMIEHRGVVNLAQTHCQLYGIRESSRILQFSSISFDLSVLEIVLALSSGATLYLIPDRIRLDRDKVWDYMHRHSINLVGLTPSFLQDGKNLPHRIESLTISCGGEALSPSLLHNLINQNITVINDYGPTETTVSATSWKCPTDYKGDIAPIGRPVIHSRVYVLDANLRPVPVGTMGELYIGGVGVARGYLNRPELTAERFLPDPFSEVKDARMYRTGDLGRRLADGNLVHLGRIDDQVKIRGFRIELEEVENCLLKHDWVSEAIVLALVVGGDKQLVAYVVAKPGSRLTHSLRAHVAAKLPQYMVPAAFVRLDVMPLTPNDKLDRKALPAPDEEAFARETYEEPRGDIENKLAAIWAELLPVKHIGRNDSFFALGGHSLLAARMLQHLKRLGLTVSVRTLFEFPTLSALARELREDQATIVPPNLITTETTSITPATLPLIELTQSDINHIVQRVPGGVVNIQDIYPLSPLQEGILFHHLMATEGDPYLVTSMMAFETRELLDRYLEAFQKVVDRHDILRTAFFWEGLSTSAQVVCRTAPLPVLELELDPADGPIQEQLDHRFNPKHYRIDLCQAPLLRFIVAKDVSGRWLLVQLLHHLIGDHDAAQEMNTEIKAFMDGLDESQETPRPFRETIAQSCLKSSQDVHKKFFQEMLEDVDEPTLPFGLTTVHSGGTEVTESHQILPQSLNTRLRKHATTLGVSLATLCHVACALVLARTSGQQRVTFGTVLFGRMQADSESGNTLGISINTLPFRCDIDVRGVRECILETHSRLIALLEHEHASLPVAQQCSCVPAGTSLFSGLLNYRHTSIPSNGSTASDSEFVSEEEQFQYPGVEFLSGQERTNYPFALSVEDFGTALGLTAQVMNPIDPVRVCAYVRQTMESLVDALESTGDVPVQQLEALPVQEREMLLQEWNATDKDYPTDLCLHHLFEQQVERTPDAIAVVHDDQSLTYAEVNTRANCLAHQLISLGVHPDVFVAICVERSPAMIIGILAIMKAGGAYVPLDPFYASDRLNDIINDAAPTILIADQAGRNALKMSIPKSVTVLDPNEPNPNQAPTGNPNVAQLTSLHLAYVIYTSGSTGKPKGVMMEHQGAVNLVNTRSESLKIHIHSRVLQNISLSFDPSVCEIFSTLCCGASLYLVQDEIRLDRLRLLQFLVRNAITHVTCTPSLLQDCRDLATLETVRAFIVMGDTMPPHLPGLLKAMAPNSIIINAYGPTETSVYATEWKWRSDFNGDMVPIGRPLPNKRVYLLDAHGNPVPLGALGEIYIGGVGVARGYLNRPELTAEKFIPDPFSSAPDARMYRTGDLGRHLPDGNIVCLGRNDHQVKIRGFRVELGEIEARLSEHPLVSEAVVIVLGEGNDKRLVAYVIVNLDYQADRAPGESQLSLILRSHLVGRLPDYMVPAAFVRMDAFPLTPNGKLDRRALPVPGDDDFAHQNYEAPQGEIESALAAIWSELLGVERVSRHDGFFALGGHSLLAVRMISSLHNLGHSISVRALFDTPTLSVLAQLIGQHRDVVTPPNLITPGVTHISPEMLPLIDLTQPEIDHIVQRVPGGVANIQDIYALSPLQDGILFHHLLAKNRDPYLLFASMAYDNRESLDRYLAAMHQLVNRHDILRTAFVWENLSTPVQVVWRDAPLSITELKLDPVDGPISEQLKSMFDPLHHRIDLSQAPLVSFVIAQESGDRWILVKLLHHIIGDHSTLEEIEIEIKEFSEGRGGTLPPAYPYRNLIAQVRLGTSEEAHEQFFRNMLSEIDTPTLPFGLANVLGDGTEVTEQQMMLPQELNNRLRLQASRLGVSLASLCHVAWGQVIARTSGQQRVVFGTVLFGRMQGSTSSNQALGLFINTLPLRMDVNKSSVESTVQATHTQLAALLEHEHASLALAQRCSSVPSGMPLFSSLMNYRHNTAPTNASDDASCKTSLESHERSNYPFMMSVEDFGTALGITSQIVRPLDSARVCGYMQESLVSLANALESNSGMPVSQLEVLPLDEREMLLRGWNATEGAYPTDLCLHQLFEQQVERTPEAIAVVYENQVLTYAEVNTRANCLAHKLINLSVQPDVLVAICVERSPAMIVGILAIMKAGGAYVPLDPLFASDRLRDILNDTASIYLVADMVGKSALGEAAISAMTVLDPNVIEYRPKSNPSIPTLNSSHLAYVIYTSGTTGKPKGVMIEHSGIADFIEQRQKYLQVQPSSRMSQFFSASFDASLCEIFSTVCFGGSLHLLQESVRQDRRQLWSYLEQHRITHAIFIPSMLQDCGDLSPLCTLTKFSLCGESLTAALAQKVRTIVPSATIINEYGPTETTVVALAWEYSEIGSNDIVPIGRPLTNKQVYLLDTHGNPVPLGALGEIYIGGVGVARGYLNRPELTAEKFIPDPFSSVPDARMYRTGDLARHLPDGNIVCLGRNDHQVKIRGFRIELGEIEVRLSEHPLVSEAVVIVLGEGNDKRLVAYVIVNLDRQVSQASGESQLSLTLRSHLVGRLPDYMIPAAFVRMDAFPLTPNGKLDRRALPVPGDDDFAHQNYETPQGEIETALAAIWSELLGVERVSRHDGFFALGGHSLLAVRMISHLHNLGHSISVRALFDTPTLSVLAQSIGQNRDIVIPPNQITPDVTHISPEMLPLIDLTQPEIDHIVQCVPGGVANIQDIYALSPLQDGILFHHLLAKNGDPYLLYASMAYDNRESLDRYLAAMQQLVNRHDILRTAIVWESLSTPVQVVWRDAPLSITELKLDPVDGPISEQLKSMFDPLHHRIDLSQAPLVRFVIAHESGDRWILVELLHHIIGDHSTLEEMEVEIKEFSEGRGGTLPPAYPYRNLIAQVRLGTSEEAHEQFFRNMLSEIDTPTLPFGLANVLGDGTEVTEQQMMLPQELNNRLRLQASRLGVSLASLCHVAWGQVIARTSGQQRVVFGTVLFGRMQGSTSSNQALGLFINTLPLRMDVNKSSVESTVQATHTQLAALLEHEHASLALAQRCSSVPSGMPLFSSLMNYRHNTAPTNASDDASCKTSLESHERSNYPFMMSVEDFGTALGITSQIVRPLDSARVCGYMQESLVSLANALESNSGMPVSQLEVLPLDEREMLLRGWNATEGAYPTDLCLHQLFEQQVERTPEAIAVVYENQVLTYAEVNTRANCLAHKLINLSVQPDVLVAICVERSPAMIVGILAIMKAGGAYVPLDPLFASDRLRDILNDTASIYLVADMVGKSALGEAAISAMTVLDPNVIEYRPKSNPSIPTLNSSHLAYVIYTSGTTGKPKGVMIEHSGIADFIEQRQKYLQVQPSSRMSQFFSASFDASLCEIFSTVCFGGSLHLLQESVRQDRRQLWSYLEQHRITHAIFIPSMLQDCGDLLPLSMMIKFLLGGELLTAAFAQKVRTIVPSATIINEYGPTETTVVALAWEYSEIGSNDIVPIGRPLTNKQVYLLDTHGNPVPLGALGEIYIGGVGVARGYLNRPELTAEKFIPDPFSSVPDARMYRTGDLARHLPDGNIVCLGRNDHQVKIRGFRIELGEIEVRLSEHPLVSEAVVIVLGEGNDKRLVAYVIVNLDRQVSQASGESQLSLTLRSHLVGRLPDYMIPAAFVRMDAFPLTPNGKLDRRVLPSPGDDDFAHQNYEAPQGEVEIALAAIWSELLGVERVSRHDRFFDLGGHSLLAVRLMNRVATLGAQVPLSSLFASPSLSAFAAIVKEQMLLKDTVLPDITPISREDMMPLSFAQQRLWFLAQLEGVSDTYHIPLSVRLRGILDQSAWRQSMDDLYSRHEALRSVFVNLNGQPKVRLLPAGAMPLRCIDLRGMDHPDIELEQLCIDEARISFDLAKGPLVRAMLIQFADDDHVLLITQHHIVSDGWSLAIMQRELSVLYTDHCNGESTSLPPLAIQYPDYAAWQRQWLSIDRLKEQGDYWRSTLSDAPVLLDLPTDRPRPPQQSFAGSQVQIVLGPDITDALRRLCRQHGVTLFMTILTAWAVVLSRLSGQDDVVIGTPSANRSRQEIESLIGFFVNTLALRVDLTGEPSMLDILERVRRGTLAAYANQDLPFEQVVEIVQPPRRMDRTPLFQVMFAWQNNELGKWDLPGLQVIDHDLDYDVAKFDLTLNLWESDGGIAGSLGYALSLFDQSTIERHIGYLATVLEQMASNSKLSIAAIDMVSADERKLLLEAWNDTLADYPTDVCLHQLFEQQVERTPEAIAVVYENQVLTYAEVNTRANCLAHKLINLGVQPDVLVAICVERSAAMIIGILAIMKAGGAYVPLDPLFASDRLRDILNDTAPVCLVADKVGRTALGVAAISSLTVLDPNIIEYHPKSNPSIPILNSSHLAYVIYTSGTTGKPKGVMIEHHGVVNFIENQQKYLQVQPSSRMSQFFSTSFDPSVCEIFGTLCFGGGLHLMHENVRQDRHQLWSYLEQHHITHAIFIPSMLQDCGDLLPLSMMIKFLLGGELLTAAFAQKVRTIVPNATIINEYGPTETIVAALAWEYSEIGSKDIVPIGRPLANKRVYLLDAHGNPVPLGALGEIYIGGVGVARGYLNRPELTAEKFIPDPFSSVPDARMYRTGDLARHLPDGNIVCLGRNDHQVKIRGFRIELGEIEVRLSEHPLVSEAVVIVLGEGNDKRLVAYVIVNLDRQVSQASGESQLSLTLRSHLVGRLPDYMIPAAFVRMDAFPLTPNGKLDRRVLPSPGDDDFAHQNYEAPQGEVEIALAAIWSELLGVERVSRHDRFFDLGGHSLLAVRLMNRVATLGAQVPLSSLFASPSLSAFAAIVKEQMLLKDTVLPDITPISREDMMPLSFAQQRLWFLAQLEGVSDTYHIPLSVRLRGILDQSAWRQSMDDLYSRHEALRSVFVNLNGQPKVRLLPCGAMPLRSIDLRGTDHPDIELGQLCIDEARTSFDLVQGPLVRAMLIQLADDDHVLLITQHHIVSDGWSLAIMQRELSVLYTNHCNGESVSLPPLAIQYPDYAAWQRHWLSIDRLKEQGDYWRSTLSDAPVLLDLPTDRPRPPQQSFKGSQVQIVIGPEITDAIKRLCRQRGVTLFMTILTAWAVVLSRLSGQDDVVIGTPSANRSRQEIESLIGFFVNTLALRIDLTGEPSMLDLLERVRRGTLAAYANQDLPFEQVVEIMQPPRRMDRTPLFQVMFAWQNNELGKWDLPGLQVTDHDLDHDFAKFDLTLNLWESDGGIAGSLGYALSLFDRSTIERHIGYLATVLEQMASNSKLSIAAIDMVSADERKLLLEAWNDTLADYPTDVCLHQLFEQQVERTPEAIAVVYENQVLTYAEVNTRANCLAHKLINLGVQPDALVAICVERSPAMIIGILAIMKAGGAYVPLDPLFVSDRLRDILSDTAPVCLVADKVGRTALGVAAISSLTVLDPNIIEYHPKSNPSIPILNSSHLAYVIYTSGTTGKPKGVMIEHHGVVNFIENQQKYLQVQPSSRMSQFFSTSFDPSVCEIFGTLCFGGGLHLMHENVRQDRHQLWSYLEQHHITHAIFIPSMLQDCGDLLPLSMMIKFLLGGELLTAAFAQKVRTIVPNATIINEYGPTETIVAALAWEYSEIGSKDIVPIGRPLANKRVYLLDAHGNPVPLGALGEIYIGGVGVARGYLNRPELTAEKFIPDPFSTAPDARMYRTGDMARHLPDGNIVCLGRNDHQVKIRGFRVELGEIEARLSECPLVSEAVVIVLGEGNDKRLVAYVIVNQDYQADRASGESQLSLILRSHLVGRLPDYMIPAAVVKMDAFPLTPNGKLDQRALPEPGDDDFARRKFEAPQGEIENLLASVWMELLNVDKIGRNDSFFVLGGHSLLAVRMISRIRTMLGFDLTLRTLFELSTIAELAPRLLATGTSQEESFDVLLPIKPHGTRPPLFCIHPGTGISWCYTGLATRLHPDQPLYGLQARGFIDGQEKASNLDDMVLDYISQVRRVQPHGPYHLLGYSFGGLVAHTMAAYLEKQSERVGLVAMMDTHANYHRLEERQPGEDEEEKDFIQALVGNREMYSPDLINPFLEKAPIIMKNNSRIGRLQGPSVFNGDLLIFRATVLKSDSGRLISPDDWKPFALGSIEICDIECEHDYMDMPEHMAEISRILNLKMDG